MSDKIKLTLEDFGVLMQTAERNGTTHAWLAVAMDWCGNANAEIERLTQALKKANDQAEHFEREWYLRGDEIERLLVDAERYRWLRNEGNPYALLVVGKHHATDVRPYYDADLDAAIDAARAALKEKP